MRRLEVRAHAYFSRDSSRLHLNKAGAPQGTPGALFDLNFSDHAGVVVTGHVAGEFESACLGKFPHDLLAFAGLQQGAVGIVVLHRLAVTHVHFHFVMVDFVGFENAVIDHHHHFFLMALMHRGRADIELVHKLALVANDEADGLARLSRELFRRVTVVDHVDFIVRETSAALPGSPAALL